MYKVIVNEKAFIYWLESREHEQAVTVINDSGAVSHLRKQLQILDDYYGEERDIEKDLGGYMIILFGEDDVVQEEYREILHYHHLQNNQFEYEESYKTIADIGSIKVRLYLCSSDYCVIVVSIKEKDRFPPFLI